MPAKSTFSSGLRRIFVSTFLLLQISTYSVHAYTVLLVPMLAVSHCREQVSIGRALHTRGHVVRLLVPEGFPLHKCLTKDLDKGIEVHKFPGDPEVVRDILRESDRASEKFQGQLSPATLLSSIANLLPRHCKSLESAVSLLDKWRRPAQRVNKEQEKTQCSRDKDDNPSGINATDDLPVDFAVLDTYYFFRCLTMIPAYLRVPFAISSSQLDPYDTNIPWPVVSYPSILSPLPGKMNLLQRLRNVLFFGFNAIAGKTVSILYSQGDAFGSDLRHFDYDAAVKNAALYIENTDYILDYPKAVYPNYVQAGGLTTRPASPLPDNLKHWFESSRAQGVVVISFGSIVHNVPPPIRDKVVATAAKVRANVLLKLNISETKVKVAGHVLHVDWLPQNDVLGQPETRLFVSHCGQNGLFETLYHGVPVLCIPFFFDQIGNAARARDFGVGDTIDVWTSSSDDIAHVINALLENNEVRQRMKRASILFRSRPETPSQRAASAIEHVIKYGGDYMRPTSADLSFVEYAGLDLCAVLYIVLAAIFVTWFYVIRFCVGKCCRLGSPKRKSD